MSGVTMTAIELDGLLHAVVADAIEHVLSNITNGQFDEDAYVTTTVVKRGWERALWGRVITP